MRVYTLDLDSIDIHQNEPKMRAGAKGFLSVPSVGMRHAPEILLLELFRDVFFDSTSPEHLKTLALDPGNRDADTDRLVFESIGERATVAALRNKRKQNRQSVEKTFFGPAYPSLAAKAWLSKKRERVITRLLFEGPFAQHLLFKGDVNQAGEEARKELVDLVIQSSLGTPKKANGNAEPFQDIFAAAVGDTADGVDVAEARKRLQKLCRSSDTVLDQLEDDLAARIFEDSLAVFRLELKLPRLLWLRILMTHLRFVLPMWLLAQMRITTLVHGWLLEAIDNQQGPSDEEIVLGLLRRNRNLLRPTLTPTRDVFDNISEYIKCRVELSVLLYCLERIAHETVSNRRVTIQKRGSTCLPLSTLLEVARHSQERFCSCTEWRDAPSVAVFVRRHCERYRAWRDPLNNGQGKNIEEFLRILYRPEMGDDIGGHLLLRQGRGGTAGFRVFPGQLLLQTVATLAANAKQNASGKVAGGGMLVLADIEEHFAAYGINFSQAADARPQLMQDLQALGLLSGSPDAGSSVSVVCPF